MTDGPVFWVVYDHPRDQPDYFIVRRQWGRADGTIGVDKAAYGFHSLAKARAWLEQQHLTPLTRHPDDDPVILETWI